MTAPSSRFCPNLSMLYSDLTLEAALGRAEASGFDAVEMWWPFDESNPSPSIRRAFVSAILRARLRLLMLNAYAGDIRGGARGIAAYPDEKNRFQHSIEAAVDVCQSVDCRLLHVLVGNTRADDHPFPSDFLVSQLSWAVERASEFGLQVIVEPQNSVDAPRYPLRTIADMLSLASALERYSGQQVGLLLDLYHLWRETSRFDLAIDPALVPRILHVQIADFPGRGAPGTGAAPIWETIGRLLQLGYTGAFGLEYIPKQHDDYSWLSAARS